jgi:glycerophosphoryl diester phosphodiesterase
MPALPDPFRIIAHRGASGFAPENTMAAFRAAVDMGATEVETDVHYSRDRHLVLLHDHSVDRTTDGTGAPAYFTLEELKALDAGAWFGAEQAGERLITLDELFEGFGEELTYHVELKEAAEGIGPVVAAVIERFGLASRCFVTGFERGGELLAAREALPELQTCALIPRSDDAGTALTETAAAGHDAISLAAAVVSRDLVDAGHALGGGDDGSVELKARMDRGRVVLEVADNGPGIVEEAVDKIFIPFFTTKQDGSGIGLSLCRQIMRLHRGTIAVRSDPDSRTVFSLRF